MQSKPFSNTSGSVEAFEDKSKDDRETDTSSTFGNATRKSNWQGSQGDMSTPFTRAKFIEVSTEEKKKEEDEEDNSRTNIGTSRSNVASSRFCSTILENENDE